MAEKQTERKYSKSSGFYTKVKQDFFSSNDRLLADATAANEHYAAQPARTHCKLCSADLPGNMDFRKHGVPYVFCTVCDHLNGAHKDTPDFANHLYSDDGGAKYSKFYLDENYEDRIGNIYIPKVDFLLESIPETNFDLIDFGCGLGYFVDASIRKGIDARGADVNRTMIEHGAKAISHLHGKEERLTVLDSARIADFIRQVDAKVLSALAVMEHLSDLDAFLAAVRSARFDYFYYSVPIYGLSVVVENLFPDVYPRHLAAGHTHLFTEASLKLLNEKLGVTPIAEWRFGTDVMDLRRSIDVRLKKEGASDAFRERVMAEMHPYGDKLQAVIDEAHHCSQIHVVCRKN